MTTTTLVTGFEPFGDVLVNPSQLLVEQLAALGLPGLNTEVLPTSYARAEERVIRLIRALRPEAVLMLGVATSASVLRLEAIARNRDDCAAPDNDGDVRLGKPIASDAPADYASSLRLEDMAAAASRYGEPCEHSQNAGGFICNHVFFVTAHLLRREQPDARCGFVHLPHLSEPGPRLARWVNVVCEWHECR